MRLIEFTLHGPDERKILINANSIVSFHDDGMDRTELRIAGNSYMIKGNYATVKKQLRQFSLKASLL